MKLSRIVALPAACLVFLAAAPSRAEQPPAPAQERTESDFLSRTRRLTFDGKRSGEGYFSPDGKKLVFQSEREPGNPFFQIYLMDLETGETNLVSPGKGKTTCSFIQPGTGNVVYASTHQDPEAQADQDEELARRERGEKKRYSWDYDADFDIFLSPPDGGMAFPLTRARGYDAECAFSPDGTKVVFASNRHAYEAGADLSEDDARRLAIDSAYYCEIYVMDASGANQTRLTFAEGYDGGPFFTPDGERIIWRRFDEHGMIADVYTMLPDGSDVRKLTDFGSMSWAPYMHPSGEYAIFATNKQGFENFELYFVDALGEHEPVRATFTDGFDGLPVFSPDGKALAWTTSRGSSDGSGQLYLADWNHEAALEALAASPARQVSSPAKAAPAAEAPATPEAAPKTEAPAAKKASQAPEAAKSLLEELRGHVFYLASDELEGRMTGSEGERLAADYIVRELEAAGLEPFGPDGSWFQEFEFSKGVKLGEKNSLALGAREMGMDPFGHGAAKPAEAPHALPAATSKPTSKPTSRPAGHSAKPEPLGAIGEDWTPLSFSATGDFEGGVAFAGYGIDLKDEESPYNSFEGLDLEGKWAMVLRYGPENVEGERRRELWRLAGLNHKARSAKARGALGIIIVEGPNSSEGEQKLITVESGSGNDLGIAAVQLSPQHADKLLARFGTSLKELQDALDGGHPIPGFPIPGATVSASIDLERGKGTGRNILAVLPPAGGISDGTTFQVLGAHYDHLGRGTSGGSLSKNVGAGEIHNGADDNGSGTAAALSAAKMLAAQDRSGWKHGVAFAFWSGEELGLIGSTAFLEGCPVDRGRLLAYVNMDMVGRLKDNTLKAEGVGSSPDWAPLLERLNVAAGFNLKPGQSPYLPTDSIAFYARKIPVVALFTGAHEDYHLPTDDADKVNYADLERVTRLAARLMDALAKREEPLAYAEVKESEAPSRSGAQMRASLGTIPDYVAEGPGVALAGARPGSAADKAGIKPGDAVVMLAGVEIGDIYDYTYAIESLKPGAEVEIVVVRHDERLTLKIVPDAR